MRVNPHAVAPRQHAGVLNGAVGVEQGGADNADRGVGGEREHAFEPAAGQHFGVVVEEHQMIAARRRGPRVAQQ